MSAVTRLVTALAAGLLFGLGLALSGMMDPAKVLGFLDIAGAWDPSLAFVLGGAVAVSAAAYRIAGRRPAPLAASRFALPVATAIDARLIGGSTLFGLGWGLAGLCPGPALAGLTLGRAPVIVFVVAMLAGMLLFRLMPEPSRPKAEREEPTR